VALCIATEIIEATRYKLRMLGVPIDGPCSTFCDNESVVKNSSIPESTLKWKRNTIAYHRVRDVVAAGILRIGCIHSSNNLADLITKPLLRAQIHALCKQILY
jgi:hypothetical protein